MERPETRRGGFGTLSVVEVFYCFVIRYVFRRGVSVGIRLDGVHVQLALIFRSVALCVSDGNSLAPSPPNL